MIFSRRNHFEGMVQLDDAARYSSRNMYKKTRKPKEDILFVISLPLNCRVQESTFDTTGYIERGKSPAASPLSKKADSL